MMISEGSCLVVVSAWHHQHGGVNDVLNGETKNTSHTSPHQLAVCSEVPESAGVQKEKVVKQKKFLRRQTESSSEESTEER